MSAKAYIEHVRKVHFSLVIVALGLGLTILLSRPAEITHAIGDLEKIRRIESLWQRDWLKEFVFAHYPNLQGTSELPMTARVEFYDHADTAEVVFRLDIQPGIVDRSTAGQFGMSKQAFDYSPTLASFRRLWDGLGERLDLVSPSEGSLPGSKVELVLWENEGDQDIAEIVTGEIIDVSDVSPVGEVGSLSLTLVTSRDTMSSRMSYMGMYRTGDEAPVLAASVTRWDRSDDKWLTALLGDDAPAFGEVLVAFGAGGYRTPSIHGQAALGDFYGVSFERYGPFSDAFRELSSFTTEIQDVSLENLARVLENERRRTSDSFQAFGMKVPAAGLSRWGSPLLVVIQLYLLLHLSALKREVSASERRSIPWIGFYDTFLSRIATIISIAVLPLAVLVVLQTEIWPSRWVDWLWSGTLLVVSLILAAFTVVTLFDRPTPNSSPNPIAGAALADKTTDQRR